MFCKNCGQEIESNFCPNCGAQNQENVVINESKNKKKSKKPFYKKWWVWLIVVFVVIIIGASSGGDDSETSVDSNSIETSQTNDAGGKSSSAATSKTTSPKVSDKEFKETCRPIDYKKLSRNPDAYKGAKFVFTGEVIQAMESSWTDTVELRINVTKETYEYSDIVTWTDTIYATIELPKGSDRILEEDIITIWGVCDGLYSYQSVLGSTVSLPAIDVKYYSIEGQ